VAKLKTGAIKGPTSINPARISSAGTLSCGSSTCPVEPLGNADDHRQYRGHALFQPAEAALDAAQPGLHCGKASFQRSEAVFRRGEAVFERFETLLEIADFGGQGQDPRAELRTRPRLCEVT